MRRAWVAALLGVAGVMQAAGPGPESRTPREVPQDLLSPFGQAAARAHAESRAPEPWQVAEAVRDRGLQGVVVGPVRSVAIVAGRVVRPGDRVSAGVEAEADAGLELRLGAVDAAGVVVEGRASGSADAVEARIEVPPRKVP